MKRKDVERRIAKAAKAAQLEWRFVRHGGNHDVWKLGNTNVTIPRHTEIVQHTAEAIFRDLEDQLGKGRWR